jgi:uncharacterized membrane protein YhaH (DUF805 family)
MIDNYISVLKKYTDFDGRARRREFWMFFLINWIIGIVFSIFDSAFGLKMGNNFGVLSALYSLFTLIPSLALSVRRLHDTGRSGYNLFWAFLPIIGGIILLVYFLTDSKGDNKYGPNPKGPSPATPAPTSPSA